MDVQSNQRGLLIFSFAKLVKENGKLHAEKSCFRVWYMFTSDKLGHFENKLQVNLTLTTINRQKNDLLQK